MRVFLLTSHPVAPPWNSGDKNLARSLLLGECGVDFTFLGDLADPTPWPSRHRRMTVRARADMPSMVEKLRLLRLLVTVPPTTDAVHSMVTFTRSRLTQALFQRLPTLRRGPLVLTCPAAIDPSLPVLRMARVITTVSGHTGTALREAGHRDVRVIAPGVDTGRLRPAPREHGREALGIGEGPVILFGGHHDPGGGLLAALDLLVSLRRRLPGARLIAALRHRPHERLEELTRALDAAIAERGIEGAVIRLGPMANMRAAILAADAVIFQPDRLGLKMELPLTLIEALACGRPVLVSPAGTLAELGEEPAVRVAAPRDDTAVAWLARLIGQPDAFAEASEAARHLALVRYDATAMAAAYAAVYADLR